MIKEVESHKFRIHWTLTKSSQVKNKHKNRDGKLKNILSIWYFKRKRFPYGKLIKHKSTLCKHGGMQQWGVNSWETYDPVVNWISLKSKLDIENIHEFTSTSIGFVLNFSKADLGVEVFKELSLQI